MGISVNPARWIIKHCREHRIGGRICTLGRQDMFFQPGALMHLLSEVGLAAIQEGGVTVDPAMAAIFHGLQRENRLLSHKPEMRERGLLSDTAFFRMTGFTDLVSIDASAFESADVVFDLNRTDIAATLPDPFDLVLDCGTIEHVFHVPNVLRNIHDLTRPGGYVMHITPCNNFVDHGFFQFSPTFFFDYYMANGFSDVKVQVAGYSHQDAGLEPWTFIDYQPGSFERTNFGGLDDRMYTVFVLARKGDDARCDIVPQQGYYRQRWT